MQIVDVRVDVVDRATALDRIARLMNGPGAASVMFVNAHSVNTACREEMYRAALRKADLVLNDGAGLALAARLQGRRFPDNLNGTDLTPAVLERAAEQGRSVFLYGAQAGVAEAAAVALAAAIPGLMIAGTADGYSLSEDEAVEKIAATGADVVLVAMGNPRQELWLARNLEATGARLGIGVGAFFDFAAGRVSRAPAVLRRARLEWLYRLAIEPRRMFRRYVAGNPLFVTRVLWARLGRHGS